MSDISNEYLLLFQAITQAADALEQVRQQLLVAQVLGEELYIEKE
ncbi:hypothetical protein RFF05_10630 [Bengtsoniella intestinalis]